MKKLLITLFLLLFATPAFADPWIVCDPQNDAHGYSWSLNGSPWKDTPYETFTKNGVTYAVVADLSGIVSGNYEIKVKAYRVEELYGRLESAEVPFAFSKPSVGPSQNLGLKRK